MTSETPSEVVTGVKVEEPVFVEQEAVVVETLSSVPLEDNTDVATSPEVRAEDLLYYILLFVF